MESIISPKFLERSSELAKAKYFYFKFEKEDNFFKVTN